MTGRRRVCQVARLLCFFRPYSCVSTRWFASLGRSRGGNRYSTAPVADLLITVLLKIVFSTTTQPKCDIKVLQVIPNRLPNEPASAQCMGHPYRIRHPHTVTYRGPDQFTEALLTTWVTAQCCSSFGCRSVSHHRPSLKHILPVR
jgi:hypothetical protein